jgi:hypothetical protein
MKINELHNQPVEPDTYEASMALNQLLKIGKHAIKIHNMIDDRAEMESWVAKKIDLAGDYVKKVHGYMQGEKAGLYDDDGLTEDQTTIEVKAILDKHGIKSTDDIEYGSDAFSDLFDYFSSDPDEMPYGVQKARTGMPDEWIADRLIDLGLLKEDAGNYVESYEWKCEKCGHTNTFGMTQKDVAEYIRSWEEDNPEIVASGEDTGEGALDWQMNVIKDQSGMHYGEPCANCGTIAESINEDAGEGHMSKSTLYHTAKYAIELMDMINKGDDLEGWVQSKLNKAADYLQGVHNYEEYQKLNPYREEIDQNVLQKHAQVVQKNIDEILARETSLDDVDTKPGMMRILAKRVNEVEKEMAKENKKNTDEAHGGQHSTSGRSMTKGEMNKREKIVKGMKKNKAGFKKRYGKDAEAVMYATATKNAMKDDKANESGILYRAGVKKYGKAGMKAIQSAAAKGANHQEIGKIKDKHLKDDEQMQEGIKDWAKNLAMAGVIVAGLAGVGSIQDAIDNSVPAVKAMNTALEMAQDQNNTELADMIKSDLSAVKVRLSSGKDLNFVKSMQDKYSKFIQTEGLAYESKLAILLNQRIK